MRFHFVGKILVLSQLGCSLSNNFLYSVPSLLNSPTPIGLQRNYTKNPLTTISTTDIEETWIQEVERRIKQVILSVIKGYPDAKLTPIIQQLEGDARLTAQIGKEINQRVKEDGIVRMLKNPQYNVLLKYFQERYDPIGTVSIDHQDKSHLAEVDYTVQILNGLALPYYPDNLDFILSAIGLGIMVDHTYFQEIRVELLESVDFEKDSPLGKDSRGNVYFYSTERRKRSHEELSKRHALERRQIEHLSDLVSFYNALRLRGFPSLSTPSTLLRISMFDVAPSWEFEFLLRDVFSSIEDFPLEIVKQLRDVLLTFGGFHFRGRTQAIGDEVFDMRVFYPSASSAFEEYKGLPINKIPEERLISFFYFLSGAVPVLNYVITDLSLNHFEIFYQMRNKIYDHRDFVDAVIGWIEQVGEEYKRTSLAGLPALLFPEVGVWATAQWEIPLSLDQLLLNTSPEYADLRAIFTDQLDHFYGNQFHTQYFKEKGMSQVTDFIDRVAIPQRHDKVVAKLRQDFREFVEIQEKLQRQSPNISFTQLDASI